MRLARVLVLSCLVVASCEQAPQELSVATSTDGAQEYVPVVAFVALKADATKDEGLLYLSVYGKTQVGLCAIADGESCTTEHETYVAAKRVHSRADTEILVTEAPVDFDSARTYVVVDGEEVLGRFKMVDGDKPTDPIAKGLAEIDRETMQKELTFLSSDDFRGRLSATPENDRAADWLIERLKELKIGPARGEDYRQRFRLGRGPTAGRDTANIVGLLEGTDPVLKDQYVIIGAHMDHAGTLQRGFTCSRGGSSDIICNGADDNGSGTIAVLNAAKALAAVRGSLKRSVIFMWFSGEEEGLLGSRHYVANPIVPLKDTVYMVNLDMVGYMRSFGGALAALGGGTSAEGRRILERLDDKYETEIRISDRAGGGSDHAPFMAKGIPGVFFHTGVQNNPNYHRTSDTADKIDYEGMTVAAQIAFETVFAMAGTDAPQASYADSPRVPLVTPEELAQACHHLIENPFVQNVTYGLDFSQNNSGRP